MADHSPVVFKGAPSVAKQTATHIDGPELDKVRTEVSPAVVSTADITYVNRVWDNYTGQSMSPEGFVRWETVNQPDPMGASYPGPGTFGVDTEDYVVETIRRGSGP